MTWAERVMIANGIVFVAPKGAFEKNPLAGVIFLLFAFVCIFELDKRKEN